MNFLRLTAAVSFAAASYAADNHGYGLAALTRIAGWND